MLARYMSIYSASEVCDSHLSVTVILSKEFHILIAWKQIVTLCKNQVQVVSFHMWWVKVMLFRFQNHLCSNTFDFCRTVHKSAIKVGILQPCTSTRHWGSMHCFVVSSVCFFQTLVTKMWTSYIFLRHVLYSFNMDSHWFNMDFKIIVRQMCHYQGFSLNLHRAFKLHWQIQSFW